MLTHVIRFCWTIALTSIFSTPSYAELVGFLPLFDATLRDDGFDGTFDSGGNGNPFNQVRRTDGVVNEVYFFEFDVSGVDASSTVTSATLTFTVLETPTSPGNIEILAYQADGVLTFPDDGDRPSVTVGSYDPISLGSGMVNVMLDASVLNGFALTGDFIGIRMQGLETDASTTIRGIQTTQVGDPPTLSLNVTAVPEPSAFALLMTTSIPFALRLRRRNRKLGSASLVVSQFESQFDS